MSHEKKKKRPKLAREGFVGRLHYFVERALLNIKQNVLVNLITVGTISLAFLILSLFLLIYVNLERVTETWSERVQVTVYFDRELTSGEVASFSSKIRAAGGVSGITYVSRDEAMRRFAERLKGQEKLLQDVTPETLPSSLEIRLKRHMREGEAIAGFVTRLKALPGIGEVQYGEEWVKRFSDFMVVVRFAGLLLGGFLVLAVVFIVANTIKLTIYSRKDELELMGLVGATRFFIKVPFLIEGILQGVAGAGMALLLILGAYTLFLHNADFLLSFSQAAAGLVFLPLSHCAILLAGGALLGFLGSLTSLKRFITL
ncbi:MAG: permease-like cell division protein FtsX [Geobacteraceae bacterium]|nr:permease-like cell division protein FtsX [Geobacteraceae bacterium]